SHTLATNYIHRDGDRLIMTARYWRPDKTAAELVKAVIIDTNNDSVKYIEDDRCGNIGFQATDSQGHLYLASHPAQAPPVVPAIPRPPVAFCASGLGRTNSMPTIMWISTSLRAGTPPASCREAA